jgi:hypothetical protein
MKFPLIWNSEKVPPNSDYKKYVEPELIKVFENLEAAENLIFSSVIAPKVRL